MYIYYVVCYRVIVAPYVRRIGHVFAYLYTLDDDSEHHMDYETSLLPKVFPYGDVSGFLGKTVWSVSLSKRRLLDAKLYGLLHGACIGFLMLNCMICFMDHAVAS